MSATSEPKLNLSDDIYKTATDQVNAEVHIWKLVRDKYGKITNWRLEYANRLALKNWGKPLCDVKGYTADVIFPDGNPLVTFMPIVEKIFRENKAHTWEKYFYGTKQILRMSSIPNGEYFINTGIDVSSIRQTEQDLLDYHDRMKIATEAAHVGVWEYDIDERKLIWDENLFRIYGVDKGKGDRPYEIWVHGVHPDDLPIAKGVIKSAIKEKKGFKGEFRILCEDTQDVKYILVDADFQPGMNGKVGRMIGVNIDITDLKLAQQQVLNLTYFDVLTGLPNRFMIYDHLCQAIENCKINQAYGALFFIDIDEFKEINDSAGHILGDELLMMFSSRMRNQVGSADILGRFGGGEFVLILNNLSKSKDAAQLYAEHFALNLLRQLKPAFELSDGLHYVTASFGITLFDGQITNDDALRQANMAMFRAKMSDHKRIKFFDPIMHQEFNERVNLVRDLSNAIKNDDIDIYYQPQVNHEGKIIGAEALVRWNHPTRGHVSPETFIGIAEETGLIESLGRLIFDKASLEFKHEIEPLVNSNFVLSINISAKQLFSTEFVSNLCSAAYENGVLSTKIKLEITESVLITDTDLATERILELKSMGFCFSLDDFGTGYSSLILLKNLPIDELKIDRSFVRDIASNRTSEAISRSIIALADSMSIGVIAEGVEDQSQKQLLLDMGCCRFQGYLFSRPLSLVDFLKQLKG